MTIREKFARSLSNKNLRKLIELFWFMEGIIDNIPFIKKYYISYWLEDEYYRRNYNFLLKRLCEDKVIKFIKVNSNGAKIYKRKYRRYEEEI